MVFMMIYYDINRTLKNFFTYIFKFEIRVDQEGSLAYVRKKGFTVFAFSGDDYFKLKRYFYTVFNKNLDEVKSY